MGPQESMTRLKSQRLVFALLLASSLVVGWRPLLATLTLALRNDQYTHLLLILPVSAALIFLEWPSLQEMVAPSVRAGSAFLGTAVLAAAFATVRSGTLPADVLLSIRMFALVLFWIGACVLSFGSRVASVLIFPLCFLFWLVPFPQVVLTAVINLLQQGSAMTAHWLFTAAGVPVSQDGVVLNIPGLTVEVSQECSSIRSSSMLLVTTMVLAQVLLRSPWRKALVIGIAVPLSVAKNGLRIFTISMLGTRVDPGYLTGRLHHQGGIVFFAVALGAVFVMIWLLKRAESKEAPAQNLVSASPIDS
jgi:exosortase